MNRIAVAELTPEAFAPFGEVGAPFADGGHGSGDVALDSDGSIIAGFRAELRERRKWCTRSRTRTLLLRALDRAFTGVKRLRRRVNPNNTATIHRTRVAFKRFRYMVEALATMLPEATKKRRADMQHYQALMGDIQDMEVLLATLRKFFKKNEIKQESARRFHEELLRRRQWLVQTYLDAADQLNDFWP